MNSPKMIRARVWWIAKAILFVVFLHGCFLVAALLWEIATAPNQSGYYDPMPRGLQ